MDVFRLENKLLEEIIVDKIDNKVELTENELKEIERSYCVEINYGDNRRWTRTVSSIVKLCNRFFVVNWEEALTEYQENEYLEQPYEVTKEEYEKTIKVTNWVRK